MPILGRMGHRILITGGAGYIGSAIAKHLALGHSLLLVDDLSRGHVEALPQGIPFQNVSVLETDRLKQAVSAFQPDTVIHTAGFLSVGESVHDPDLYRKTNWLGYRSLMSALPKKINFLFSSSCTVYGNREHAVTEDEDFAPISPYGYYKARVEEDLTKLSKDNTNFHYASLRYFNVAGSIPAMKIGQRGVGSSQLIKSACEVAMGKRTSIRIHLASNKSSQMTCVRDWLHIQDLIDVHLSALEYLWQEQRSFHVNCGSGEPRSVENVLNEIRNCAGSQLPIEYHPYRAGDADTAFADIRKARSLLGWSPKFSELSNICQSALKWERLINSTAAANASL